MENFHGLPYLKVRNDADVAALIVSHSTLPKASLLLSLESADSYLEKELALVANGGNPRDIPILMDAKKKIEAVRSIHIQKDPAKLN